MTDNIDPQGWAMAGDTSGPAKAGAWPDELYLELDEPLQDTTIDNLTATGIKCVTMAVRDTDIAIFKMMSTETNS